VRYDYGEAIGLVKAGERVRRVSWASSWLFLAQGGPADGPDKVYLIENRPGEDERATEFVARPADLMAADWEIVMPRSEDFMHGVPSDLKTATELGGALGDPGVPPAAPGGAVPPAVAVPVPAAGAAEEPPLVALEDVGSPG